MESDPAMNMRRADAARYIRENHGMPCCIGHARKVRLHRGRSSVPQSGQVPDLFPR